ncbi:MAG TPA: hypothetical protein DHW82_12900 [Spirochaetia bacterium]|nr:MAG: hypothetical protein A2Y41_12750 [Spirochaetes bacterium GWB1_36_13]HCL57888.1 hypothetical protein [Spirochaetia bacterium]
MSYQLKFLNNKDQFFLDKVSQMNIPNTDDLTDEKQWVENAKERIDIDLMMMDQAIEIFSGN